MKSVVKGAIAAAVLVLAAAVALVPRWQEDSQGPQRPSAAADALAAARKKAQLPSCPGDAETSKTRRSAGAEPVPELEGVSATCSADGSTVALGSALAGQVTLVNVWATWCQPCREELPVLDAYAERAGSVNVLTVQVASDMLGGLRMLAELDVHLPVVHDGTGNRGPVRRALDVPATLPASYVISAGGEVSFVKQPRVFHNPAQVRDAVRRYSGGQGGGSR